LGGIRIVAKDAAGHENITTADTGTLSPGSVETPGDFSAVRLTLRDVKFQTGTMSGTAQEMMLVLRKQP
jgi:hypothetical protein